MILPNTPSTAWLERYETLRRYVLDDRPVLDLEPLGLVLWLARGMAGWMRSWIEAVKTPLLPAVVLPPPPFSVTPLWQQQLTRLLAQITVQRLFPAPTL